MTQKDTKLFAGMRPLEISEYGLLTLLACAIPYSWNVAVWVLAALVLNSATKLLLYRRPTCGLPTIGKVGMFLSIGYFLLYLVSILYSANKELGWENITHKLPFILFPLIALTSDLKYLTPRRLRNLLYSMTFACSLLFLIYTLPSLFKLITQPDTSSSILYGDHGIVKHHTYYAMYFLLAIAFIYQELRQHWTRLSIGLRIVLIVCALFMAMFVLFIQSRAGILCMGFLVIWGIVDLLFVQRNYRVGLLATALIIGGGAILFTTMGDAHKRLTHTIVETATEGKKDVRFEIAENALGVIRQHWAFGVGIGDRIDELDQNHDKVYGIDEEHPWPHYNPHNQYLDSWVAIGLPGMLVLIAMLMVPAIGAIKKERRDELLLALIFLVAVTALFESIFERQMGILYFGLFYMLLQHPSATHLQEDSINRLPE